MAGTSIQVPMSLVLAAYREAKKGAVAANSASCQCGSINGEAAQIVLVPDSPEVQAAYQAGCYPGIGRITVGNTDEIVTQLKAELAKQTASFELRMRELVDGQFTPPEDVTDTTITLIALTQSVTLYTDTDIIIDLVAQQTTL